jgi:hypothetical protein
MRSAPPHTALSLDVDVEHALEALRPSHRRPPLGRGAVVCLGRCLACCTLAPPGLGHLRAVRAVRGKHAVEAGEIDARFGHQRGQSCDEIQRLEEHVRGTVRVGRLQLVAHQAARGERQARLRHRRAANVPAQPLELFAFIGPHRHAGVQTEAADLACRRSGSLIAGRQAPRA